MCAIPFVRTYTCSLIIILLNDTTIRVYVGRGWPYLYVYNLFNIIALNAAAGPPKFEETLTVNNDIKCTQRRRCSTYTG